ncbi:class I SAM-dependent methyltransferase [Laspinema olomoucense]|uniref:class I SAM-dependent methyltransferase n=1 Tax=Laspinema olomoucense TaxID=3231600 RepID=UPI0021BA771F|nr:class I SAM-dependent methyltransferase [Laspinema sp. D3c]MCT7997192.1 class I SAM-dependent methyltransferase [Laspinema sp. D3c]
MLPDPILSYYRTSFHQPRAIEIIKEHPWKGDEHILDVGCGDGRITAELAQRVPEGSVLGIDLSEKTVQFAKNRFPKNQYPNLDFCHLDFMLSDYQEKFDVVVSMGAMHYISDQSQALKKIKNSLKHDGQAILFLVGLKTDPMWQAMAILLSTPKWKHLASVMSYGLCTQEEYFVRIQVRGLTGGDF